MDSIQADITRLPLRSIIRLVAGTVSISKEDRAKKDLVVQRVLREAPPQLLETLRSAAVDHEHRKAEERTRKCKRELEMDSSRKTAWTSDDADTPLTGLDSTDHPSTFLELPSKEEVNAIYQSFYSATGNDALASGTCGVDIPHAARLRPRHPHPMHNLVNEMLLERTALHESGGQPAVSVCGPCHSELRKGGSKPPRYSVSGAVANCTAISAGVRVQVVPETERGSTRRHCLAECHARQCVHV